MNKNMIYVIALIILVVGGWWMHSKYQKDGTLPISGIDKDSFIQMAQKNGCAEGYDLYTIDDTMVFWAWTGMCQDNAFGNVLFGSSPDTILCNETDSFGGSKEQCNDLQKQALFDIINIHKKEPNLGLDSTHKVEKFDSKRKRTF